MTPERDEAIPAQPKRSQLPPLAPRQLDHSSSKDRSGSSSRTGRPPRLSHRSRAGCWTCRARKVKCDEQHPKCGPCTRLNRDCDWDHRWNFSDATSTTQNKYGNVTTSGNTVWDPHARRSPDHSPTFQQFDDLPAFAILTNDDERERKAESSRPGTFGVVVTPESFADLPEYAGRSSPGSRRASVQSTASSLPTYAASLGRTPTRSQTDPNVVVLDRFEDVALPSAGLYPSPTGSRRPSLPDAIQYLSISTSPLVPPHLLGSPHVTHSAGLHDPFVAHFRHYVLPRLIQPQIHQPPGDLLMTITKDIFEIEALRFTPLYQAICALSALNLSYSGAASVDAAHSHYGQALQSQSGTTSPDELLSNGAFLRHFLLFVYDVCIPMQHDESTTNMWAIHLNHLQSIAVMRHNTLGPEQHGYMLWTICELDVYACLLGSGDCSFVRTITKEHMMPGLEQQIPQLATSNTEHFLPSELMIFPPILALRHGILIRLAKIAQTAQMFREEAANAGRVSPGSYARWQSAVSQLQAELVAFWTQAYPPFLGPEAPHAGRDLPPRPRQVFEQAFFLYQTATVYSRTSMFFRQRSFPIASQQEVFADTESRVMAIIALAATQLEAGHLERRHVIFPLFIAGFATMQPDLKVQALNIIKAYEGEGLGQNTYTTRRLLTAVYEEQRRVAEAGGRMEDVDWLRVARDRSLTVVNCGL